jgi:hypothetical protein
MFLGYLSLDLQNCIVDRLPNSRSLLSVPIIRPFCRLTIVCSSSVDQAQATRFSLFAVMCWISSHALNPWQLSKSLQNFYSIFCGGLSIGFLSSSLRMSPGRIRSVPVISDRQHNTEREIAAQHLGGFTSQGSNGQKFLEALCPGRSLTLHDLKLIALLGEFLTGIPFHRDFQRSRVLIVKWISDHYVELLPMIGILQIHVESH